MQNLKQRNSHPCPLIASTYSSQCQLFVFNWNISIIKKYLQQACFMSDTVEWEKNLSSCLHRAYILLIKTQAYSSYNIFIFLKLTPKFKSSWSPMDICESLQTINFSIDQTSIQLKAGVEGQCCLDFWTAPDLNLKLKLSPYNWVLLHQRQMEQEGALGSLLFSKLFPMIPQQWVP